MKRLKQLTSVLLSTVLAILLTIPSAIRTPARELPHDPVYHKEGAAWVKYPDGIWWLVTDKKDWTDWSYIYYGSYPQSEITNVQTINRINTALNNADHGDVSINNVKYRKISINDVTSSRNWGENTYYRYFKWEPIKWKVIHVDEKNNKLLIMSDKSLNNQKLNNVSSEPFYMWETCSLRNWLNGYSDKTLSENTYRNKSFMYEAFSDIEIENILPSLLYFFYQKEEDVYQQTHSYDRIFMLKDYELEKEEYGFRSHIWKTEYSNGIECATRAVKPSDYSLAMGDWNYGLSNDDKEYVEYWGFPDSVPNSVNRCGIIYYYESDECDYSFGVVPAMYIDLNSNWEPVIEDTENESDQMLKPQTEKPDISNTFSISNADKSTKINNNDNQQQKSNESINNNGFTAKITKLKKDTATIKLTNKTSSSLTIKTNDSKFKKKKIIKIKPNKSKTVKLKLKSKKHKKNKLKLKFTCTYNEKKYIISINSKKAIIK